MLLPGLLSHGIPVLFTGSGLRIAAVFCIAIYFVFISAPGNEENMPGGSSSKQCNTIGKEHLNTKKLLHSLLACSSFCVLQSLSAESGSAVLGCELGAVITDVFVDVGNKDFRTVVEP